MKSITFCILCVLYYVIITSGLRWMEQLSSGTLLITVQGKIENIANHKLVLRTFTHILLAKSNPKVNPNMHEVGER